MANNTYGNYLVKDYATAMISPLRKLTSLTEYGKPLNDRSGDIQLWIQDNKIIDNLFTQPTGIFNNLKDREIITNSDMYRIIILYMRMQFCKYKIKDNIDIYGNLFIQNAISLLQLLPSYLGLTGGSKKQKGGMDTAKIYNVQGLIQEMSDFNRGDSVSLAMNIPSPFSGSTHSGSMGVMDTLPPAAVEALMPPLPIAVVGGKKKKVKTP